MPSYGLFSPAKPQELSSATRGGLAVLAATAREQPEFIFNVNVPAFFKRESEFQSDVLVNGGMGRDRWDCDEWQDHRWEMSFIH